MYFNLKKILYFFAGKTFLPAYKAREISCSKHEIIFLETKLIKNKILSEVKKGNYHCEIRESFMTGKTKNEPVRVKSINNFGVFYTEKPHGLKSGDLVQLIGNENLDFLDVFAKNIPYEAISISENSFQLKHLVFESVIDNSRPFSYNEKENREVFVRKISLPGIYYYVMCDKIDRNFLKEQVISVAFNIKKYGYSVIIDKDIINETLFWKIYW